MPEPRHNRLAAETSPYLLQHAGNPVDWYPWGAEALERAKREDKPILLSIGYSSCHWCHVMAHESFEDEATASVMNEHFVNIKVDREERPDLDRIYQTAHQLLTRRAGGWPLTMFLAPDQTPFAGGTYFPTEPRYGLPSFRDLLQRIGEFYRTNRGALEMQNDSLRQALAGLGKNGEEAAVVNRKPMESARRELAGSYDRLHGGFGRAPKFPHASNVQLLLRLNSGDRNDAEAERMALHTLRAMAEGGLFDQLGGGFFRYSVDERWEIPHFEKMLYDNAQLLPLYVDAWQITGDTSFRRVAEQTAAWVCSEMQSSEGGYYSTLDADIDGHEGGYYVWRDEELRALLNEQQYRAVSILFGLDEQPNFEGQWHLRQRHSLKEVMGELTLPDEEARQLLREAWGVLLAARQRRTPPGRDEKILTAWNALMIKAMASAGRRLVSPDLTHSAEQALAFIRTHLWRDGRLLAVYKEGRATYGAYLDDYAYLIDAILTLLEARWQDGDLQFAMELADALLDHFEDESTGGFYFTADDHERLIHRPKPFSDESMPSGNGVAAYALLRLGHLIGDLHYLDAAERTLRAAWSQMSSYPTAHGTLLLALDEFLEPPQIVVIRGQGRALGRWLAKASSGFDPRRLVMAIPSEVSDLPGQLAERKPEEGVVAYVCGGHQCSPPVRTPEAL